MSFSIEVYCNKNKSLVSSYNYTAITEDICCVLHQLKALFPRPHHSVKIIRR